MQRLFFTAVILSLLVVSSGCNDPDAGADPLAPGGDPVLTRLDDIQANLFALQEQISEIQRTPGVQEVPTEQLQLRPVVPVEPAPSTPTKAELLRELASTPPAPTPVVRSRSTRKKASYTSLAKKHIRVSVPPRAVQQALQNAGVSPGKIDGKVGERTIAAIRAFQKQQGLKVDGIVGPATWARLQPFVGS